MSTAYSVTPELLEKFKIPFGILISGASVETMSKLERMVKTENPSLIVSVGDIVTRNLHAHGTNPKLSVTDNKCGRKRIPATTYPVDRVVHVKNPRGMITEEAITTIKEELKRDEPNPNNRRRRGRLADADCCLVRARKIVRCLRPAEQGRRGC